LLSVHQSLRDQPINTGAEAADCRPRSARTADPGGYRALFLEDPDVCQNILDLGPRVKYFHLHDSNGGAAIIGGARTI
jgi:hypothetical protein